MTESARTARAPVVVAATVVGLGAWLLLVHLLIVRREHPLLLLAVVVLPWFVALGSLLRAGPDRTGTATRRAVVLASAAAVGLAGWFGRDALLMHADFVVYGENLLFLVGLAVTFAVTLRPGRDALITRLARVARRGDMPPAVVRYTRAATLAWAVFFAVVALSSTALYVSQPLAAWSTFANLALWPLVGAMFVGEYVVRLRVLRGYRHGSMMAGVRAFRHRADLDGRDARGRPP